MTSQNRYDTIIIGAGMSGLAAGIRLAYFDRRVLVVEKHSVAGGLNSYYRRKGRVLDVGLHAMTNFVGPRERRAPLNKALRQLKLKWEDLELVEQTSSMIDFPGCSLRFSNDPHLLRQEIARAFPSQIDGFNRLVKEVEEYDAFSLTGSYRSARETLGSFLTEPLLVEMLMCPLMYYGSSWENDMDFGQFVIMFRSIFLEGFCRPRAGVMTIINLLKEKYLGCGGELRFKAGVEKILMEDGATAGIRLESGEELRSDTVLSSAGLCETLGMVETGVNRTGSMTGATDILTVPGGESRPPRPGTLGFTEVILFLKDHLSLQGHDASIIFYNNTERFRYQPPGDLVSLESGVICSPDNFAYPENFNGLSLIPENDAGELAGQEHLENGAGDLARLDRHAGDPSSRPEPILRVTNMARYESWSKLARPEYKHLKEEWQEKIVTEAARHVPLKRDTIVFSDMFTPTTVKRFTGHLNGAVYGSPDKVKDGRTGVENLFICGTDQGFLGIVGAMLSGISMANLHCLQR